jgi:hypothetical protein
VTGIVALSLFSPPSAAHSYVLPSEELVDNEPFRLDDYIEKIRGTLKPAPSILEVPQPAPKRSKPRGEKEKGIRTETTASPDVRINSKSVESTTAKRAQPISLTEPSKQKSKQERNEAIDADRIASPARKKLRLRKMPRRPEPCPTKDPPPPNKPLQVPPRTAAIRSKWQSAPGAGT